MIIREMTTLDDFQACVNLQKIIWGFDDPYDVVPLPLLMISARNDGVVLGAYDDKEMIGFVYGLPGFHKGKKVQWSHMLAVKPDKQNSDIGYQLKIAQYKMSQERGYELIEWTYDPLESRNAHFNLRKLGCIIKEYEINIYGETSSHLHKGSPTDRFIAHWQIPPLIKTEDWNQLPNDSILVTQSVRGEDGFLRIQSVKLDRNDPVLFVEIPNNIQALKAESPEEGLRWRLQTRAIFTHYFDRGYVAYTFLHWKETSPSRSFYVLKKADKIESLI